MIIENIEKKPVILSREVILTAISYEYKHYYEDFEILSSGVIWPFRFLFNGEIDRFGLEYKEFEAITVDFDMIFDYNASRRYRRHKNIIETSSKYKYIDYVCIDDVWQTDDVFVYFKSIAMKYRARAIIDFAEFFNEVLDLVVDILDANNIEYKII